MSRDGTHIDPSAVIVAIEQCNTYCEISLAALIHTWGVAHLTQVIVVDRRRARADIVVQLRSVREAASRRSLWLSYRTGASCTHHGCCWSDSHSLASHLSASEHFFRKNRRCFFGCTYLPTSGAGRHDYLISLPNRNQTLLF